MFVVFQRKTLVGMLLAVLASGILVTSLWNPSVPTADLNSRLIVVDAGHGGMDGGGVGLNQTPEKELNLQIAMRLEQALSENGYQVIMTRKEDVSLHDADKTTVRAQKNSDLKNRAKIANEQNAGLFVSIHMNKYETSDVRGAQVFYKKADTLGENYAKNIMAELKKLDPENHRLQKELPNANLLFQKLNIPAVLVECGFLSNEEDLKKLNDESYQNQLVHSIVTGIQQTK